MKRKTIGILAVLTLLFAALGLFAGCGGYDPEGDLIKEGYTVHVTLDALDGTFEGRTQNSEQLHLVNYYIKPGSKIPPPGYNGGTHTVPAASYAEHRLLGWFYGEKNEEGEVTYGEQFDFEKDKVDADLTLYAKWERRRAYRIVYKEEGKEELTLFNTYYADDFEPLGQMGLSVSPPSLEGKTFLRYVTQDGSDFDMEAAYPSDGTVDVYVYTEFLNGEYILVRTADDLISKTVGTVNSNFYLLDDIDFTGKEWTMAERFNGTIEGNGYSIRNVTFEYHNRTNSLDAVGLFANMGTASRQATIRGLTFENVSIVLDSEYDLKTVCNIGFLCGRATHLLLEDVSFENCSLSFAAGAYEKYQKGGFGNVTDSAIPYLYGMKTGVEEKNVTGAIIHPAQWDAAE